jgi:hypothetical protein
VRAIRTILLAVTPALGPDLYSLARGDATRAFGVSARGPDLYSLARGDATRAFGVSARGPETEVYGRRIFNSFISAVQVSGLLKSYAVSFLGCIAI